MFRFERSPGDSRAYVELHPEEGVLLRVDDDFYDGELAPAAALKLANAIQRVFGPSSAERVIRYRGSVTDLATDIAGELTTKQARELVAELQRFMGELPDKFKG